MNQQLIEIFEKTWGKPAYVYGQAPGRVNLIGEHTDYNDGFVMPCAIDFNVEIAAAPNQSGACRVVALDFDDDTDSFSLTQEIVAHPTSEWANYVRGVVGLYPDIGGFDMVIKGHVPVGAGLSSSAAIEVAIGTVINALFDLSLAPKTIALRGQQAENEFVGCQCGIMDQMISAQGKVGQAMLLDCRHLSTDFVTIPTELSIMIIHSNVKRGLVDSEYNDRRTQCESAAKALGVPALRDATMSDLLRQQNGMDEVVFKRARHIISENERTQRAFSALAAQDMPLLSQLMAESHASMRDDFAITVPQIDFLVDIIHEVLQDKGGVRMTGGGFGGCVVALVPNDAVSTVTQTIEQHYQAKTGLKETIYICRASAGASATLLR